jgi:UDP-GlcNAc:undecaprenyl-phosphate GlcNAc-1-phosphate transferase
MNPRKGGLMTYTPMFLFQILLYSLSAGIFASVVTPIVIRIAFRLRILDAPNHRKVHKYSKPRVGGLAMFGVYFFIVLTIDLHSSLVRAALVGSVLITMFGFLDDLFNIKARVKLLFQLLVAFLTVSSYGGFGIAIEQLAVLRTHYFVLGWASIPFTMLWIVGVMNAINLIDGLDGLAGGIAFIASLTLGLTSLLLGQHEAALLFFILAGVVFGFLRYNFNPAKLFMGDSGSYFLGFNLALLSIAGVWNADSVFAFSVPFLVLGIPFYDVVTSIIRRIKNNQPIFYPDGQHIHHRLIARGFTHQQTVIVIYLETAFLAAASLLLLLVNSNIAVVLFFVLMFLVYLSTEYLRKYYR